MPSYRRAPSSEPQYAKRSYHEGDVTSTHDSVMNASVDVLDRQEFFSSTLGLVQIGPYLNSPFDPTYVIPPLSKPTVCASPSGFYQALFLPITPVLTLDDVSVVLAEPLGNVSGGNTYATGMGGTQLAPRQPLYPWSWLQNLGQNYEEWQLKALQFEWVPLTSYQTLGQIVMSFTPDATAKPGDFNSYQSMMSTSTAVSGSIWAAIKLDIPVAATNMPDGWKTVQSAPDTTNTQSTLVSGAARGGAQQFFAGFFMVAFEGISTSLAVPLAIPATTGTQTANNFIPLGTLKARYDICLRAPVLNLTRLTTPAQQKTLVSQFGSAAPTALLPFGVPGQGYPLVGNGVTMHPFTGPSATSQCFSLAPGRFLVFGMLYGAGLTSVSFLPVSLPSGSNGVVIDAGSVTAINPGVSIFFTFIVEYVVPTLSQPSMFNGLLEFDLSVTPGVGSFTKSELFFTALPAV